METREKMVDRIAPLLEAAQAEEREYQERIQNGFKALSFSIACVMDMLVIKGVCTEAEMEVLQEEMQARYEAAWQRNREGKTNDAPHSREQ